MKPYITVVIQDHNRFYVQGIQYLLQAYFTPSGMEVQFAAATASISADLVVCTEPIAGMAPLCRMRRHGWHGRASVIVVRESGKGWRRTPLRCPSELGTLTRSDKPDALLRLVGKILDAPGWGALSQATCKRCSPSLTWRERQVLRGLESEMSPERLASLLGLSPKTISTHKRNAMRKLGFRRNSELYYWLRQGGLGDE